MLQQQFLNVATRHPDHPAVVDRHGNIRTYADLLQDIEALRARLHAVGLRNGDVVVTQLGNSTGYVALLFAMASLELVHCPISLACSTAYRAKRLKQVHAAVLVTEYGTMPAGTQVPSFALRSQPPATLQAPAHQQQTGLMRMQETTGAPGALRLALWRQEHLHQEILHWVESAGLDASARYLNIHSLDSRHATDLHVFPALLTGATLYLGEAANVEETLRTLDQQRITVMSALPSHYLALAQAAEQTGIRLPALAMPLCEDPYLDEQILLQAERCLGIHIKRIYGCAEFGMILADFSPGLQLESGMRPLGNVEVTLTAIDPAYPDIGEISARCAHHGSGYYPLASDAREDDVHACGDIARRLDDGSLILMGRATDALLSTQGIQFTPAIERHIAQTLMPECVVVMVDEHDRRRACVAVQASATAADQQQKALRGLLDRLGISATITVLDKMPLTTSGKPDRTRLRRQLGTQSTGNDRIPLLKSMT